MKMPAEAVASTGGSIWVCSLISGVSECRAASHSYRQLPSKAGAIPVENFILLVDQGRSARFLGRIVSCGCRCADPLAARRRAIARLAGR
jgi:hypothetical protein